MYTFLEAINLKKVYNFRLNRGDDEIKEILERNVGSESNFIKAAILFYGRFGERIDSMAAEIKAIHALLESGNLPVFTKNKGPSPEGLEEPPKKNNIDAEKMIRESIMDIINWGNSHGDDSKDQQKG